MVGRTISHYKILSELGRGGMGVVYKAEDIKLERTVALKFLASHLLEDEEGRARFIREAKAAAALDHPNICTVHEIDEVDGETFIAMAVIEGQTVKDKIAERPLKLEEALDIAIQTAQGLQAAHEKGIVHRDIKSANLMVTPQGQVKVMDFGLAQLAEQSRLTKTAMFLGTPAYMSPEQAQKSTTDRRTDIWSLGVVIYEMVTGKLPFERERLEGVLYAIGNEEPEPITALRAGLPMELEWVVGKAMAKDATERYQHVEEMIVDLRGSGKKLAAGKSAIARTTNLVASIPTATATNQTVSPARTWLWPAVAALLAIVAIALVFLALRPESGTTTARFSISLPPGQEITSSPAISGDGQIIAYAAQLGTAEPQLYLRHLDSFEARAVAGSSGAQQPFFSPDGKWVAFFAQGQLQKAEVAGGAPIRLAEAATPSGGTWNLDDTIIYAGSRGSGLLRIPASGGTPEALTNPDGAAEGYAHVFPQVLPGGRSVLFTILGQTLGGAVLSLDSGQWEMVLPSTTFAAAIFDGAGGSTGRLLVVDQAAGIRGAPFDAAHPARTSADTSVLAGVYYDVEVEVRGWLAVSNTGTAVYVPANPAKSSLVWVDKEGTTESLGVDQGVYREVRLSPDGTKAAVRQGLDLWIHDLQRGTRSRLTPANTFNSMPRWSSDGARIIFALNRGGDWDIYSQPADGSGPAEALLSRPYAQFPTSVLADGTVLYSEVNPQTGIDLWTLPPGGLSQEGLSQQGTTSPFRVTPFNEKNAEVSPGPEGGPRWVAYTYEESGRNEIYVQSYPSGANRIPISTGGGFLPRWSRDGRELFYITGDAVAAVAIRPDGSFGAPRRLFDRTNFFFSSKAFSSYDTSPDGKRFLMIQRDPGSVPRQLNVILNWADER